MPDSMHFTTWVNKECLTYNILKSDLSVKILNVCKIWRK